jgi:hypothetical protein
MGKEKVLIFTGTPRNENGIINDNDAKLIETAYDYQYKMLINRGIKANNIIRVRDAMTPELINSGASAHL